MAVYGKFAHKLLEMYASPEAIDKMKNDIEDYKSQIEEYENEKKETYNSEDKEAIDKIINRLKGKINELEKRIEVARYNPGEDE